MYYKPQDGWSLPKRIFQSQQTEKERANSGKIVTTLQATFMCLIIFLSNIIFLIFRVW